MAKFIFAEIFLVSSFLTMLTHGYLLKTSKIDLLGDVYSEEPPHLLEVDYGKGNVAKNGNFLPITSTLSKPKVTFNEAKSDSYYLLYMIDEDVPFPNFPIFSGYIHWQVKNIPGKNVDDGETMKSYNCPLPLIPGGNHRYVFLMYDQKRRLNSTELPAPVVTTNFDAKQQENSFGPPVAGNYFEQSVFNY